MAASLGVVHFVWRVKKDLTEPLIYGGVLVLLFAIHVAEAVRKRRALPGSGLGHLRGPAAQRFLGGGAPGLTGGFYNPRRRNSSLGYVSPAESERTAEAQRQAA